MISSLQHQMAGEPSTLYQIRSHHSWVKTRGHQPKKELNPGMIHTDPLSHHNSYGLVGFHHLFNNYRSSVRPESPAAMPEGFSILRRAAGVGSSGSSGIKCLARYDVVTGTHAHLTAGTRVLGFVRSPSYMATPPQEHA
jgi:hypothetical protein